MSSRVQAHNILSTQQSPIFTQYCTYSGPSWKMVDNQHFSHEKKTGLFSQTDNEDCIISANHEMRTDSQSHDEDYFISAYQKKDCIISANQVIMPESYKPIKWQRLDQFSQSYCNRLGTNSSVFAAFSLICQPGYHGHGDGNLMFIFSGQWSHITMLCHS